jgi:ribonuclease-3 family protein
MTLPSGQALAYLGDAVYEVTLRHLAIEQGIEQPEKLHQFVSSLTHAQAQYDAYNHIQLELSEEEKTFYKRGRNAPVSKKSRHVSIEVAHGSTGFEAIFGGLYLNANHARIKDICVKVIQWMET